MGEVGNYRVHNSHSKASSMSNNNHMNFSSGPSSTSRFMPSIPENGNESITTRSTPDHRQLGRANSASAREFEPMFPQDSWNDTSFNTLKRNRDDDDDNAKMFSSFNGLDNQVG